MYITELVSTWHHNPKPTKRIILAIHNPNRYRISRKLTLFKIIIYLALLLLVINFIIKIGSDTLSPLILFGFISAFIISLGILYYLNTRKIIEYDDIEHVLYVLNPKGVLEHEVPVARIDKIIFSSSGIDRQGYFYKIIFRDFYNQRQQIRFFTIPFRKDINTIIIDTKLENPNLVTRNWSIGWNELFD